MLLSPFTSEVFDIDFDSSSAKIIGLVCKVLQLLCHLFRMRIQNGRSPQSSFLGQQGARPAGLAFRGLASSPDRPLMPRVLGLGGRPRARTPLALLGPWMPHFFLLLHSL